MHLADNALRFEPASHIHRFAPDVERSLAVANDAADNGSGMDTHPQAKVGNLVALDPCDIDHGEPEIDGASGVVRERLGQATSGHVRVADGLDLLEAARGMKTGRSPVRHAASASG